jgi:hypothetical protein
MDIQKDQSRRDDFLMAMYGQMWGNIDRHILVIWQSVAALLGAFAVFALIEKNVLPLDLACALLVLICAWVAAHVVDANYWFARNLVIITNIERQFLTANDAKLVHPYFLTHRKPTVLDHLAVQAWLAVGVFGLVIGWHFCTRIAPGFTAPWCNFEFMRALPYVVTAAAVALLVSFRKKQRAAYSELLSDSPGAVVTRATDEPSPK